MKNRNVGSVSQFSSFKLFMLCGAAICLVPFSTAHEGIAQGSSCTGTACGDVVISHVGLAMQFENHGTHAIVLSVSRSVGMPDGCSTPIAYQLGPGDKQLITGHICVPFNAAYH